MELKFNLKAITKTCYRFEMTTSEGGFNTLYLKKDIVDKLIKNPQNGITIHIEEEDKND